MDFHGEKRSNETHESSTDPEAKLARKGAGKEAKLSFAQHVLMENRNGLIVDVVVTEASGTAEREAALNMLDESVAGTAPITLAADRGYHVRSFIEQCRARNVTPHIALNERKDNCNDGRTTRHQGYSVSQRIRKRVEETFGWMKTVGGFRKTRFKGVARTQLASLLVASAYNLLRIANLRPRMA